MDLSRFRLLLAPAFAALFALLTLCTLAVQYPPSMGFRVPLLRLSHVHHPICDGDWLYVELLDDGTTRVHGQQIRRVPLDDGTQNHQEDLALLVSNIMATRAERLIYVVPSSGIPYSRLLETMSTLKQAVPDMHIGVLSGEVKDAFIRHRVERPDLIVRPSQESLSFSCEIEWLARDF